MALTPRFRVDHLDAWGRLVKSWATGLDYVSTPFKNHPPRNQPANLTLNQPLKQPLPTASKPAVDAAGNPLPWCLPTPTAIQVPAAAGGTITLPFAVAMTVPEFETLLTAGFVVVGEMPPKLKHVVIVQGGDDTMVFRLPPKDTLQGSEDDLLNGEGYDMPLFYNALYPATAPTFPDVVARKGDLMQLHANRIGEYTLNNCS